MFHFNISSSIDAQQAEPMRCNRKKIKNAHIAVMMAFITQVAPWRMPLVSWLKRQLRLKPNACGAFGPSPSILLLPQVPCHRCYLLFNGESDLCFSRRLVAAVIMSVLPRWCALDANATCFAVKVSHQCLVARYFFSVPFDSHGFPFYLPRTGVNWNEIRSKDVMKSSAKRLQDALCLL